MSALPQTGSFYSITTTGLFFCKLDVSHQVSSSNNSLIVRLKFLQVIFLYETLGENYNSKDILFFKWPLNCHQSNYICFNILWEVRVAGCVLLLFSIAARSQYVVHNNLISNYTRIAISQNCIGF